MLEQDGKQLVAIESEGSSGPDGLRRRDVWLVLEHGDVADDGALPHPANYTASLGSGPVQLDLTLLDHIRGVGLLALLEEVGAGILLHVFPGSGQRFQVSRSQREIVGAPEGSGQPGKMLMFSVVHCDDLLLSAARRDGPVG